MAKLEENEVPFGFCDVQTGKKIKTFKRKSYDITSLAFSPDRKILAFSDITGKIKLLNLASNEELKIISGGNKRAGSVVFSFGGNILASGNDDGSITFTI